MSEKKSLSKPKAEPKVKKEVSKKVIKNEKNSFFFSFVSTFSQALAITAILILLTVSFVVVGLTKKVVIINNSFEESPISYSDFSNQSLITKKPKTFFGNLSPQLSGNSYSKDSYSSKTVQGKGLDSPAIIEPDVFKVYNYNYIYTGEPLGILSNELAVYRRTSLNLGDSISKFFSKQKIASFDLANLSNINLSNINLDEDRPYGYSLYIDLKNSNFSLYKNWQRWPQADDLIPATLSDQEILNISNRFLRDYEIDLSSYASGIVQTYQNVDYVSEVATVVYPLIVDNFLVYEEYGDFSGLTVQIDLKEKRVSGLFGVTHNNYESSLYDSQRDNELILKMLKQGGRYPEYFTEGDNVEEVDVEVGTPVLALAKIWRYADESRGEDFLVPAYVFPVLSKIDNPYFSKKNIVIPLVKDFYDNNNLDGPVFLPAAG